MTFGKRVKKVRKNVSKDDKTVDKAIEKVSGEDNSVNSSSDNNNSSSNIIDSSVKASSFLKRKGKSKKSNMLLFGMTKEEKLELFIRNIKIIHPGIPEFWLQKEIQKFKKKFNIE